MKLYAVRVFVGDWPRACDFYGETLGLAERFRNDDMGGAEFDLGGPSLGVERVDEKDGDGRRHVGRFLGVSLMVDDVEKTHETLHAKGVRFDGPPENQPWGGVLTHFEDPDGNVLTLLGRSG